MKLLLTLALLCSSSAIAGEVLQLKAGLVSLDDHSQRIQVTGNHTFIVQFAQSITQSDRDTLEREGFNIARYLPVDALVVQGDASRLATLRATLPSLRAIASWRPEWKLDRALHKQRSTRLVVITTWNAQSTWEVRAKIDGIPGGRVVSLAEQTVVASLSPEATGVVSQLDAVEWIEEMPFFQTFEFTAPAAADHEDRDPPPYTGHESGTRIMNFPAAQARGYFGEGQVAAMADTGLDTGTPASLHKDFSNFKAGFAFGMGSSSWEDVNGHGTHVAGSILGTGEASQGLLRGGAPKARLVVEGLWSSFMGGLAFNSDMNKMLGAAYKEGARVHSNSWGNPKSNGAYDNYAMQMDTFMWKNPDFLLVFAAGNGGTDANSDGVIDTNSMSSPGTAKNVLTVGASENLILEGGQQKTHGEWHADRWGAEPIASDKVSNNPEGLAAFSSRGPTSDGRTKPEIVAPGTNIVSVRSHGDGAGLLWGIYNDDYLYCGGTSMATPLTSGAATVTREYLVKDRGITNPSAALVKATLIHTAHDMFPGQYGLGATQEISKPRPNVQEGYGRVDMDAATALGSNTLIADDRTGVGLGEEHRERFVVEAGMSLRATLVYTDAPAATAASVTLVNDLDLEVTGPDGVVTSLGDRRNNYEMIELKDLKKGAYDVRVKGFNIPQGMAGKQPFALVVTVH